MRGLSKLVVGLLAMHSFGLCDIGMPNLRVNTPMVRADCGSIPYNPAVEVFEPNQRAVIAFDGKEEILLLSTDLHASVPTKVLEVIPLPNEPEVTEGDVAAFVRATDWINARLRPQQRVRTGKGAGGAFGAAAADAPAGEVTFHEKIGAHDVSVVKVLERERFVDWVDDHLRRGGVDNPTIPRPLRMVVDDYLEDGFAWFAFNVVELGTETKTKEALKYRFATSKLYFPLRITRTEKGVTTVRLILISPRLVEIPEVGPSLVRLLHQPLEIDRDDLKYLDEDIADLLSKRKTNLIRIWEIKGQLSRFRHDVYTSWHR